MLYQLSYCPRREVPAYQPVPGAPPDGAERVRSRGRSGDVVIEAGQRVSLCSVCLRSRLQYFFISRRSRSLIFDFIVM